MILPSYRHLWTFYLNPRKGKNQSRSARRSSLSLSSRLDPEAEEHLARLVFFVSPRGPGGRPGSRGTALSLLANVSCMAAWGREGRFPELTTMGRPEPCVLFSHSFVHAQLDEYVDEVSHSPYLSRRGCFFFLWCGQKRSSISSYSSVDFYA